MNIKRRSRRRVAALFAAVALSASAFADFVISDGIVTGYEGECPAELVLPKGVTGIGAEAFSNRAGITSVTIPYGVVSIGDRAFYGCADLANVTIPYSVRRVGDAVFDSTAYWYAQDDGVVVCSGWAVGVKGDSDELVHLELPEGTFGIADMAFCGCNQMTSAIFPDSLWIIGDWAFRYCENLEGFNTTSYMGRIGCRAFADTAWWNNQQSGIVKFGDWVLGFKDTCPSTIELHSGCVADEAFRNCGDVTSVQCYNNGELYIGDKAFEGCANLQSVSIEDYNVYIGGKAFYNCPALTALKLLGEEEYGFCTAHVRSAHPRLRVARPCRS